jgi:uncharacterized protein (DUF58 family)
MNPLQALDETSLSVLARIAGHLLNSRYSNASGHKPLQRRAGSGIEFLDHRAFAPGDEWRSIDWRVSARHLEPQVRRFNAEVSTDWMIVLDCSASMSLNHCDKWKLALQCTAALAYLLLQQDNRVGILLFGERVEHKIPLGRGYAHYAHLVQLLAQWQPTSVGGGSRLGQCLSAVKRRSSIMIISDFLTADAMQNDLHKLSIHCDRLHTLQIFSDHDSQLPAHEFLRLQDIETEKYCDATITEDKRKLYQRAFEEQAQALANFCRTQQIHHSRHNARNAWKQVVLSHFMSDSAP